MNELLASIIIAVIQGLTEWLPISSSGHLVLFEKLLNYPGDLTFEVALHFGTLMAVFVYFGKDIVDILKEIMKGNFRSENGKLGLLLLIGTIPAAVVGLLFNKYLEIAFDSLLVVAVGFAITSLILFIASLDFRISTFRKNKFGWKNALFVGCAQALALFPGISRSGSTIAGGLLAGLKEKDALKFSFLLSIPAIFGAAILEIGNNRLPTELLWATLVSFAVGLLTIYLLLNFVLSSRKNLRWFAIYTLALAVAIGVYLLVL
jgi:undecaprenyl-diphosphatase